MPLFPQDCWKLQMNNRDAEKHPMTSPLLSLSEYRCLRMDHHGGQMTVILGRRHIPPNGGERERREAG